MSVTRSSRADATIARLEVCATGLDPIVARQRIESLLGMLELVPRGLPPPTILCVRRLVDPLPGVVSLVERALRPPPAWERAMQQELDRLGRAAAWPARAFVAPSAEAVAFADEGELLACLGSDLLSGLVAARWWWRLLIPAVEPPRRAVAAAWRRAVEHAPAALARLAERRQAVAFVAALEPADTEQLRHAIAARFALPLLARAIPSPLAQAPTAMPPAPAVAPPPSPPWRPVTPDVDDSSLPPAQAAFVGLVLALARAPSLARSDAFATAAMAWTRAVDGEAASAPARALPPPVALAPPPVAVAAPPREPEPARAPDPVAARESPPFLEPAAVPPLVADAPVAAAASAPPPAAAETSPSLVAEGAPATTEAPPAAAAASPEPSPPVAADAAEPASPPATTPPLPAWRGRRAFGPAAATKLGGLFYLLNFAVYLGLYGDDENLPLSPWDFVELLGRRLLDDPACDDDPVWPLLGALGGRDDGEPAGARFSPPDTTRETWLELLAWYARLRLRLALGLDDGEDPATLLLRHPARVHVTDTHVDVVLSLEKLPVAIRLAGLDRDPGWLGAAGRFIAFHFE